MLVTEYVSDSGTVREMPYGNDHAAYVDPVAGAGFLVEPPATDGETGETWNRALESLRRVGWELFPATMDELTSDDVELIQYGKLADGSSVFYLSNRWRTVTADELDDLFDDFAARVRELPQLASLRAI